MPTEIFVEQETQAEAKLRLFSLYVDFAASQYARWASGMITRLAGACWKTCSEMWKLDTFQTSQRLTKIVLRDAAEADVLLIALGSLDQREPQLIEWLDRLAGEKAKRPASGLLIGLLGGEDQKPGELEWTLEQFIRCAQKMGRDFIWRWMGQEAINDTAWLADNMKKSLSHKLSWLNMSCSQEMAPAFGHLPETFWLMADTG